MGYLQLALLILAGILACSTFIVAKKPDAKAMIDKLVPFQAFIGVGLLAVTIINWVRMGLGVPFQLMKFWALGGITLIGAIFSGILLGFLFGMPQIAKWVPGESSAEQKALDLSRKIAPIQMIVGVVALVSGVLFLLMELNILKP